MAGVLRAGERLEEMTLRDLLDIAESVWLDDLAAHGDHGVTDIAERLERAQRDSFRDDEWREHFGEDRDWDEIESAYGAAAPALSPRTPRPDRRDVQR